MPKMKVERNETLGRLTLDITKWLLYSMSLLQHCSMFPLDMDYKLQFISLLPLFNKNGHINGKNIIQNVSTLTPKLMNQLRHLVQ
jgi:hypothetical protein